jgi:hypothetical protein
MEETFDIDVHHSTAEVILWSSDSQSVHLLVASVISGLEI